MNFLKNIFAYFFKRNFKSKGYYYLLYHLIKLNESSNEFISINVNALSIYKILKINLILLIAIDNIDNIFIIIKFKLRLKEICDKVLVLFYLNYLSCLLLSHSESFYYYRNMDARLTYTVLNTIICVPFVLVYNGG